MKGSYGEFGEFRPCETACEAQGICRYPQPFQDQHHIFFEKNKYQTPIEKRFRNLAENIIEICRCKHDEIHGMVEEPEKPSRSHMVEKIEESGVHITRAVKRSIERQKRGE